MSFGLRSYKARRRRAIRWKIAKAVFVLCGLLAAGMFAYEGGSLLARQEVFSLEKQVKDLNGKLASLEVQNTELMSAAESALERESEWQQRYKTEVPQGQSRELYELLHDRLAAGIEADRLAFVIGQAKNASACDGPTQTKRFLVKTPLYEGANDSVGFDRETVTVTAEGATATNAQGRTLPTTSPCRSPRSAAEPRRKPESCRYIIRWSSGNQSTVSPCWSAHEDSSTSPAPAANSPSGSDQTFGTPRILLDCLTGTVT
jgi:hypothetical protein